MTGNNETRQKISDDTGFDNGDMFEGADDVRRYFTVKNMQEIFGRLYDENLQDQEDLDKMAATVIENKWHMNDQPCDKCGTMPKTRECSSCGKEMIITDCGHQEQPRPISAGPDGKDYCDGCYTE